MPRHLLTVDVPVVSSQTCNDSLSYNGTIDEGMVCAGNLTKGSIDSCQGDSGGPFICNKILVGVVSFGKGCGLPYFPGVYANVSYFRSWILKESDNLLGIDGSTTNNTTPMTDPVTTSASTQVSNLETTTTTNSGMMHNCQISMFFVILILSLLML